jgi:A/G-specific adenine glycosylase
MLQQTQAERGARYFEAWMRRFPDIRSVAEADEEAVLAAWEGLGYYSRARNLQRAARYIMEVHGGEFPSSVDLIRALPGVGEYTAGAVAAVAFNLPEPAVDANVRRLLARLGDLDRPADEPASRALITETARALIPAESARLFNQALMELGALVCARKPGCGRCRNPKPGISYWRRSPAWRGGAAKSSSVGVRRAACGPGCGIFPAGR